jgi:hypothetical protein
MLLESVRVVGPPGGVSAAEALEQDRAATRIQARVQPFERKMQNR